jgi:hypothetical protein
VVGIDLVNDPIDLSFQGVLETAGARDRDAELGDVCVLLDLDEVVPSASRVKGLGRLECVLNYDSLMGLLQTDSYRLIIIRINFEGPMSCLL